MCIRDRLDKNEFSEEISLDFKLDKVYNIYGRKFKFVLSDKILSKKYLDYDLLKGKLDVYKRQVYRIPITNIIMDTGIGYYQAAYPVYQILLTISTAGLPIAVAKLVSENYALGRIKAAHKDVFKRQISCFPNCLSPNILK